MPEPGDTCPNCGDSMQSCQTIPLASFSQVQTDHSFMNSDGKIVPLFMLTCRLNTSRLLACIAEIHHDEHGLILPFMAAPYPVHLVLLQDKEGIAQKRADELAQALSTAGLEALYDDRSERAGVKFNDADLIGIPLRLTISQRSLTQGGVELKRRADHEAQLIPLDGLATVIDDLLSTL
jgi:prolyl-tRNA synthetase